MLGSSKGCRWPLPLRNPEAPQRTMSSGCISQFGPLHLKGKLGGTPRPLLHRGRAAGRGHAEEGASPPSTPQPLALPLSPHAALLTSGAWMRRWEKCKNVWARGGFWSLP